MASTVTSPYAFPMLNPVEIADFFKQRFPGIAYVTVDDIKKPQVCFVNDHVMISNRSYNMAINHIQ